MAENSTQMGGSQESGSEGSSSERELGQATIVYEGPDGERTEKQVANEEIAYFQDHWLIKTGQTRRGKDTVKRIPAHRVYHVERDVEEFKEEVKSLRHQVQSIASEVKSKISGGGDDERSGQYGQKGDQDGQKGSQQGESGNRGDL